MYLTIPLFITPFKYIPCALLCCITYAGEASHHVTKPAFEMQTFNVLSFWLNR